MDTVGCDQFGRTGVQNPPEINGTSQIAGGVASQQCVRPIPRIITIIAQHHGYVVTVGCQSFAIEKASTVIRNLEKYLVDPELTEKKWMSGQLDL